MRKVLNIIGYISIIVLPVLGILFIFDYFKIVKILCLIALFIIVLIQIIHYKKTKIEDFGIRILITVISICICNSIIHNVYGIIKNNQAQELAERIEKILIYNNGKTIEEITFENNDNKLKFLNTKFHFIKGYGCEAEIYYKNGTIEKAKVIQPESIIIINDDYYYFNMFSETKVIYDEWNEINIGENYFKSEIIELDLDGDNIKEKIGINESGKYISINDTEYMVNKYYKEENNTYDNNSYHFVDLNGDGIQEIIHRTSDLVLPITDKYTIYNYKNKELNEVGDLTLKGSIPYKVDVKENTIKFEYRPYEAEKDYKEEVIYELNMK